MLQPGRRRFPGVHPVTMNAVGTTAGAAVLLSTSMLLGDPLALPDRVKTLAESSARTSRTRCRVL